jgi:hypothetical protein
MAKYGIQLDLRGFDDLKQDQKLRFCQLFGVNTTIDKVDGDFTVLLT